jgi:hypothetical protein
MTLLFLLSCNNYSCDTEPPELPVGTWHSDSIFNPRNPLDSDPFPIPGTITITSTLLTITYQDAQGRTWQVSYSIE